MCPGPSSASGSARNAPLPFPRSTSRWHWREPFSRLEWLRPEVAMSEDRVTIALTMQAPSAEAAMHHLRGTYKSALFATGIPEVGSWPLTSLAIEPSAVQLAASA
jgi:hypothetical protein